LRSLEPLVDLLEDYLNFLMPVECTLFIENTRAAFADFILTFYLLQKHWKIVQAWYRTQEPGEGVSLEVDCQVSLILQYDGVQVDY
jgi:hypothetical protein